MITLTAEMVKVLLYVYRFHFYEIFYNCPCIYSVVIPKMVYGFPHVLFPTFLTG